MKITLGKQWQAVLANLPETAMGSQTVNLHLVDGRVLRNVVVFNGSACETATNFNPEDIKNIVLSDPVSESIEEVISRLVEADEELPAQAHKAATFQSWLEKANIPYTRSIKKEEWLLGTRYNIEYIIEGKQWYSGMTGVYFTVRIPKREAYVSGTHGRTSESVLVFHKGKRLRPDIHTAFLYAQFSREMHGRTVEP